MSEETETTEFIEVPLDPEIEADREAWEAAEYDRAYEAVRLARHAAYTAPDGSDAVFMKYQRDEATKEEWLAAKAAIDDANPYPEKPTKGK